MYRALHERSNVNVSITEHLKFQEKVTFTHALWVNSCKSKEKKLELEQHIFWKCYIQGAPRKKQYHSFFRGVPIISRIFGLIVANQNKIIRIRTLFILKMLYTGYYTKEVITLLPSRSTWNFKKKWLLHMYFGLIMTKQNKKTRIRTLYILKMLYTGCSTKEVITLFPVLLLLSWITLYIAISKCKVSWF